VHQGRRQVQRRRRPARLRRNDRYRRGGDRAAVRRLARGTGHPPQVRPGRAELRGRGWCRWSTAL